MSATQKYKDVVREQLLGFWLVPGDPISPRSNACVPPLVDIAGFVMDWSSLNDNASAEMAKCGAAGVKNPCWALTWAGGMEGSTSRPRPQKPLEYVGVL